MKVTRCDNQRKLVKAVPKRYREQTYAIPRDAAPFSLVVLSDSVAHSTTIEKAISKRHTDTTLIVAAENLSQEAAHRLAAVNGYALTLRDHYWTDDTHRKIQQFGGRKEKPRENNS